MLNAEVNWLKCSSLSLWLRSWPEFELLLMTTKWEQAEYFLNVSADCWSPGEGPATDFAVILSLTSIWGWLFIQKHFPREFNKLFLVFQAGSQCHWNRKSRSYFVFHNKKRCLCFGDVWETSVIWGEKMLGAVYNPRKIRDAFSASLWAS